MKLHTAAQFLSQGTTQLPQPPSGGEWRGVAIHSSSEVDMVSIGGLVLGVGGIYPAVQGGITVNAVRRADGSGVGEKLTLALYETCDALVPMAARAPSYGQAKLDGALLPATAATARQVLVLPFAGKQQAAISFERTDTTKDLHLFVLGSRAGYFTSNTTWAHYTSSADETWWNGGGSAPTDPGGNVRARTIYIGGQGDNVEGFDTLFIYVYGTAPAGAESIYVTAEAWGERNR